MDLPLHRGRDAVKWTIRQYLFPLGVSLLRRVVLDIQHGKLVMRDQESELASWKPSLDGAPRLFRPELPMLGTLPDGYEIIK